MKASIPRLMLATLAVVAVAAAVSTGGWYWRRARDLGAEEQRIAMELQSNQRLITALRHARDEANADSPAAPHEPAGKLERPPAKPRAAPGPGSLTERLRARPEYARFAQLDRRRATWRVHGDLFNQLALSPERLAQFKRVLDEAGQTDLDVHEAAALLGIAPADPSHARLMAATRKGNDAKIRAVLEPEEWAAYQEFKFAQGWNLVYASEFRDFASERGAPPLSPQQNRALTGAFARAQEWILGAGENDLSATAAHRRLTARFAELAGEVLAPEQRAALAAYLEFTHSRGELLARLVYPDRPPGSAIVTIGSGP